VNGIRELGNSSSGQIVNSEKRWKAFAARKAIADLGIRELVD
jgi:hypothetical protein